MTVATRQTKRATAAAKGKAAAEKTIAKAKEEVTQSSPATGTYSFTKEDILRVRDEEGLSWANVARELGLKNPGQARTAYTELTGTPHYESRMPRGSGGRAPRGTSQRAVRKAKDLDPKWHDDSDQDEIIEKIQGMFILVRRPAGYEEELYVQKLKEFTYEGKDETLVVHFNDEAWRYRAVRVRNIVEVRPHRKRKVKTKVEVDPSLIDPDDIIDDDTEEDND